MRTSVALGLGVAGGLAISWLWQRLRSHPSWRKAICGSAAQTQTPPRSAFKMEDRLSLVARAKRPAPLRGLLPISKTPGVVNMAGGTPHPSLFPVKSYTLELVDGAKLVVDDATRVAAAQQYMHDVTPGVGTVGYLPLLAWLRTHVVEQHAPPYEGWDVCVCTGNADGFQRAWEALLDPGDTMLCDALDFAFSTAQLAAWTGARGLRVEALPETRSGDAAAELRALLDSWREQRPGVAFPKACARPHGRTRPNAPSRLPPPSPPRSPPRSRRRPEPTADGASH
jgi:DNA-binding transcriptional MocR family regulator